MRPALLALLLLLSSCALLHASSVTTGPWQLDTELNDTGARQLLTELTFQLQPAPADSWLISSSALMLSNPQGLGPSITLSSSCNSGTPNCSANADVYQSINGSLLRVGHLHPKEVSIFHLPSNGNGSPETPPSPVLNESDTLLGSIVLPVSLPLEWLWAIALVAVVLITGTFLVRNRD